MFDKIKAFISAVIEKVKAFLDRLFGKL